MAPPNLPFYQKDEKVLCFHHELLYEAKVLDYKHTIENDKKSPYQYLVHYKGWKATSSSTFLSYRTSTTTSLAGQVSILCTFSAPSLSCWPKTEDIVLSAPENPPFSFAGSRYQPKSTKATVISLAGQESLRSTISRHSHPSFYKQKLFTKYLSLYILSILQYRIHRQSRPESWASSSSRTKLLTTPHLPSSDCALPYWLGLLPFQPPSTRFDTMCCFRNIWNNVKAFVANFSGITGSWDDWVPQDRIRKDSEENRELAANLKAELTAALKPRPMASSTKKKAVGSDVSSMRGSEERQTPVTGRGQKRGRDNEIEKVGDSTLSSERPKKRHRKATEYHTRILKSNEDPSASPLNVDYSEGKATKLKVGEMQTAEKEASTKWSMQKDRDKFTTEFPDSCLRRRPSSPSQNNDPDPPKRVDRPLLKRKRSTGSLDSYWEKEKAINESYIKPPAPDASYLSTLSGKDYLDKKGKQKRWIDNDLNGPSTDEPKPVVRAAYAAKRPMIAGIPLQETPKDLVGRVSKKRAREENFNQRPAIHIPVPDHLKSLLVDDWEYVTKNLSLIPLPAEHSVNAIVDAYFEDEKARRRFGSAEADILQEVVSGIKEYFDKTLGKILLYRFERQQYLEVHKKMVAGQGEWENKAIGDIYGAEHLARLIVSLPELIAQTNMDEQSVRKLREEVIKLTAWLGKNSTRFFTAEYEPASQEYIEKARGD